MQLQPVNEFATAMWGALGSLFALAVIKYIRDISKSIAVYKDEHDIMWEDHNVRHGLPWRQKHGRGRTNGGNGKAKGAHA